MELLNIVFTMQSSFDDEITKLIIFVLNKKFKRVYLCNIIKKVNIPALRKPEIILCTYCIYIYMYLYPAFRFPTLYSFTSWNIVYIFIWSYTCNSFDNVIQVCINRTAGAYLASLKKGEWGGGEGAALIWKSNFLAVLQKIISTERRWISTIIFIFCHKIGKEGAYKLECPNIDNQHDWIHS